MSEYLAFYTIYSATSEVDRKNFQTSFDLDSKSFAKREGWELREKSEYRFEALNKDNALDVAKSHGKHISIFMPSRHILGATLDELFEIKSIKISG